MDGVAGQADEDRLYGLMKVAERQQAAVQAALERLAAERAALAREREALARGVAGLQSGTQGAVAESLAGAATEGVAAVQAATGLLLLRLPEARRHVVATLLDHLAQCPNCGHRTPWHMLV